MGWSVADAHVFVDDGISGAEFERRPGLQRLLAMAETRKPPFHRLVVSEQKSIGREMAETGHTIKRLAEAGIEIFEYVHGKSLTPRRAIDKIMSNVQGFADEAHREATSERVHEAHARRHKAGHCVGGRIFGYKNRTIYKGEDVHGRPLKSHVERVIDPDEAAVVRRIFELYDSGYRTGRALE
jgi:site-specific DNA recombinase